MPETSYMQQAIAKIEAENNENLLAIWDALRNYELHKDYEPHKDYAPTITMDDWASLVYSEIHKRGLMQTYQEQAQKANRRIESLLRTDMSPEDVDDMVAREYRKAYESNE